jgi:voltage-gated potassium channel
MADERHNFRRQWAERTAPLMFFVSLIFLANVAALIVLWVDVPRVGEDYQAGAGRQAQTFVSVEQPLEVWSVRLGYYGLSLAIALWPLFVAEYFFYRCTGSTRHRFTRDCLLIFVCPPLRIGLSNPEMGGKIWLPRHGWCKGDEELREQLEKYFGIPMIVIALMILPILLVEFGLKEQIAEHLWLRVLLHVSTGTIWFAFAMEFILMCSVADKKLRYCREHWLDLAIILLPFISFLRSLRAVRATRLAKLAKVQQLTKLGRVYRLRGLAVKGLRAMLLFEVLNRILSVTPEKQIATLRERMAEKESEIRALRRRIASLEARALEDRLREQAEI